MGVGSSYPNVSSVVSKAASSPRAAKPGEKPFMVGVVDESVLLCFIACFDNLSGWGPAYRGKIFPTGVVSQGRQHDIMYHFKTSCVALVSRFNYVAIESVAWVTANVTEVTSKATSTHFVLGSGPFTRVWSVSGIKSVVMAVK